MSTQQSKILTSLVENAELASQTSDYIQLNTILNAALATSDIYSYQPFLQIPSIASYADNFQPVFFQSNTSFTPQEEFQVLCKLMAIFSTGTTASLYHFLNSSPQPIFHFITSQMISKLEILTLLTILEEFLLSTQRFRQFSEIHNFPCITLQHIQTQFTTQYKCLPLLTILSNQTVNQHLQQFITNQHEQRYWSTTNGISISKIFSLLTKSISTKLITGVLHNIMNDNEGYIELTGVLILRDVALSNSTSNSSYPASTSLSHLVNNISTLIHATQYSIELASTQQ